LYIQACGKIAANCDRVRYVIAGRDMVPANRWLAEQLEHSRRPEQFDLLGFVADREGLYSAADCLVVTSESEGSPNMVYEAMATGLPVIILGTLGTEAISAPLVERLASRDPILLADSMLRRSGQSLTDDMRAKASAAVSSVRHPMVAYFEREFAFT
jgi:hypothetical protein